MGCCVVVGGCGVETGAVGAVNGADDAIVFASGIFKRGGRTRLLDGAFGAGVLVWTGGVCGCVCGAGSWGTVFCIGVGVVP